jgi:hypothetical protein
MHGERRFHQPSGVRDGGSGGRTADGVKDNPGNGFSFNNYVSCAMDYHLAHDMQCAFPAGSVEDMKHDVPNEP